MVHQRRWLGALASHFSTLVLALIVTGLASMSTGGSAQASGEKISLAERLVLLTQAYPGKISGIDGQNLIMADGTRLVIDDGETKTHGQKLLRADIEDMLSQVYPVGRCAEGIGPLPRNFDPGRIRNTAFFKAIYGLDKAAVSETLVTVNWYGTRLRVSETLGADKKLRAVAKDLAGIEKAKIPYLRKSAGAFNWRTIAGTPNLSVHSFGIAVDLNPKRAAYWRWSGGKPGNVPPHKSRIPPEIIAAFERHGFIWGGRWYHFDTMHFEYRPALIAIGRLAEKRGCVPPLAAP